MEGLPGQAGPSQKVVIYRLFSKGSRRPWVGSLASEIGPLRSKIGPCRTEMDPPKLLKCVFSLNTEVQGGST